jgi:hypothetical protein
MKAGRSWPDQSSAVGTYQALMSRLMSTSHGRSGSRSFTHGPTVTTALSKRSVPASVRISTPFATGTISRTGV